MLWPMRWLRGRYEALSHKIHSKHFLKVSLFSKTPQHQVYQPLILALFCYKAMSDSYRDEQQSLVLEHPQQPDLVEMKLAHARL